MEFESGDVQQGLYAQSTDNWHYRKSNAVRHLVMLSAAKNPGRDASLRSA